MSKVIIVSRTFPAYHPRKGEKTNFVRSIWEGLDQLNSLHLLDDIELEDEIKSFYEKKNYTPKFTTIRAGKSRKEGDWFSPRVWSGLPYQSKQIIIAPDLQIVKIWDIDILKSGNVMLTRGQKVFYTDYLNPGWAQIAMNDGLSTIDLFNWFKMPCKFSGQVICWNPEIDY